MTIEEIKFVFWMLFVFALALDLTVVLFGVVTLLHEVATSVRKFLLNRSHRRQTEQHIAGIRAIGQQARSDMEQVYYDYIHRVKNMNRR